MLPYSSETVGPILFLHIPKTGGTSLINLLRLFTRPEQCFTEAGNRLSRAFLTELADERLSPAAIIHGHADWGACIPVFGRVRIVTMMREPRRQLASHFLHAIRDPAMPQHAAAKSLGFEAFLRTYPRMITFQTSTLYGAVTDLPDELRKSYSDPGYGDALGLDAYAARQLGRVFAFLEDMALVGVLENGQHFVDALSHLAGWSYTPQLPHDNATGAELSTTLADMAEIIAKLEQDPELGPLFAIERATYAKAKMLSAAYAGTAIAAEAASRLRFPQAGYCIVHTSSLGQIMLGRNFRPEHAAADWWDRTVATTSHWWTGNRQLSELFVKCDSALPCRLTLRVDCLHAIEPHELRVCLDNRWLTVDHRQDKDGQTVFSVTLPAEGPGNTASLRLALYLEWNRYPTSKPFYPAVRITAFSLDAAIE